MKYLALTLLLSLNANAQLNKLADPLLQQGLVNNQNYSTIARIAENYKQRNSLNFGWLNTFRSWNSGETLQNRSALDNKRSSDMMIFDMDRGQPLDWTTVTLDQESHPSVSDSQFTLAVDPTHINNPQAPVVLLLLSNQHVINDYLSNSAYLEIRKMGVILAVMEYPGFGVSVGIANKKTWMTATEEAVKFLSSVTQKKIFLLGHSIGGPLALETAAENGMQNYVAGAMSYGGFTTLTEMAKDEDDRALIPFFAPTIARFTMGQNNLDGISGLKVLAKNNIPALIMHGENDGAVPVRHAYIYAAEAKRLKPGAVEVKIFPGLIHEEVNNFTRGVEKSEKDFSLVWGEILNFMNSAPYILQAL